MSQRFPPALPNGGSDAAKCAPCADDNVDPEPLASPRRPLAPEIGGPSGPEPTRYGDWEFRGRCTDF